MKLIVPAARPVMRLVNLTDREHHWSGTGSKLLHAVGNSNLTTDCLPAGCNLTMHRDVRLQSLGLSRMAYTLCWCSSIHPTHPDDMFVATHDHRGLSVPKVVQPGLACSLPGIMAATVGLNRFCAVIYLGQVNCGCQNTVVCVMLTNLNMTPAFAPLHNIW